MQLLIAGSTTKWTEVLEEKLRNYKYRDDVVLLKNAGTALTAKLVAACYAMVYPSAENIFPLAMLWALQSNKAIIASGTLINRQISNAAEWVEPGQTAEGFAKAMMSLYKDEAQQLLLVQQTKEAAVLFNRQIMLDTVWQCIEQ